MKNWIIVVLGLAGWQAEAQSIVGTWQLTDEKTCFESNIKESETEKELLPQMGSSKTSVARLIKFDKKGNGEEGVFSTGSKKGTSMTTFKYRISGQSLQLLDGKSGVMTQNLVIDSLTQTFLRFHNEKKDCEIKTLVRVK